MTDLPTAIKQMFFNCLSAKLSLVEFEQWVYTSKELKAALHEETYLTLIAFNYKQEAAKHELYVLLEGIIDLGEFETFKLIELLNKAKVRNLNLPSILERFYDLYCDGYYFLNTLGLGFGLWVRVLPSPYRVEHWSELTESELKEFVDKLPSELNNELDYVLQWLDDGKIVLTSKRDEYNRFVYIDNRNEAEKKRIPQFNF